VRRLALIPEDARRANLPSFPVTAKAHTTHYPWWKTQGLGGTCWELDAMSPVDLRRIVQTAIEEYIDWEAWFRCDEVEAAEQRSMQQFITEWNQRKAG